MILHGDLFERLKEFPNGHFDACVTDPPYGIGFMGKEWDTFKPAVLQKRNATRRRKGQGVFDTNPNLKGRTRSPAKSNSQMDYDESLDGKRRFQVWTEGWAREVLRVLKPGAYLLACGAPRSYHRLTCGLEDAGFEVRDCFSWLFGQGYPKSLDIGRAIDMSLCELPGRHCMRQLPDAEYLKPDDHVCAETEMGREWAEWGSGLKPGWEPIVVARKPFKGSLARNVRAYGTGAINIDGCRLESVPPIEYREKLQRFEEERTGRAGDVLDIGRWPANVLLDEDAAALIDAASGDLSSGAWPSSRNSHKFGGVYENAFPGTQEGLSSRSANAGGASRFYYVAKPSREERDAGTELLRAKQRDNTRKAGKTGGNNPRNRGLQPRGNYHPTVKPVALMRWLVRLVTPLGGIVLDPFTGSGTTGMACRYEMRGFVGIEREAEYVAIAEARITNAAPLLAEMLQSPASETDTSAQVPLFSDE